jgi:hypothetical protein
MPLSSFQYQPPTHYREVRGKTSRFAHSFGGDPAAQGIRFVNCEPMHLIYRLNQADPVVGTIVPGIEWLPLCYHFSYASWDGQLIYRVPSENEVELIAPTEAMFDPDFPLPGFPRQFPQSPAAFSKQKYDPAVTEDSLQLAAVFGVDQLSPAKMQRAIQIADETCGTISDNQGGVISDWSAEDVLRNFHRQPFFQGAPTKSCENPNCTAEIAYRRPAMTISPGSTFEEVTGEKSLTIPARDVRRPSLRVFAIHQPDDGDDRVWPHVQIVFQVCECCHCIRVTNQCT